MSGAIKNTQVIQQDIFKNAIDSALALEGVLKKVLQLLKKDLKGIKFGGTESFKKFNEVQKDVIKTSTQLNTVQKEREKLMKQQETLNAKQITQKTKIATQNEKIKQDVQKQAKATKDLVKWQNAEVGSVNKLLSANTLLTKRRDAVNVATEKGRKRIIALNRAIDRNNASILKNADAMKKQRLNIGNYGSAVKGLAMKFAGALGLTSGIYLAVNAVKKIISTFSDFYAMTAKVQAVSGATNEQFKALLNSAKKLGETTVFTATQVAELQLNLSKLGLTPEQILKSEQAILDLAAATGEDLATSATVAASTMRGFGLEADQMGHITDVMALSFSSSALDLNKFQVAMAKVAPVAKTFGFSLEDSTSLLAKLSDAGFDASTAATSTRNILLNLADSGGALAKELGRPVKTLPDLIKGLKELKEKGVDLGQALELTDKRSVAAFTTFLDGADSLQILSDELKNADGTAKKMADTMLNNLAGDTKIAQSATEGLAIAIGEKLNPFLRSSTQMYSKIVGEITKWIKGTKDLDDEIISFNRNLTDELATLESLFYSLKSATEGTEERKVAIEEINSRYGDYLDNLLTEESSLIEIEKAQKKATDALIKQIAIKSKQADIENAVNKNLEVQKSVMREVVDAGNDNNVTSKNAVAITNDLAKSLRDLGFTTNKNLGLNKITKEQYELISQAAYKLGLNFGDLEGYVNDIVIAQIKQENSIKAINDFYKAYIDTLDILEDEEKKRKKTTNDNTKLTKTNTDTTEKAISILAKYKKELSELNKLIELKAKAGEGDISIEQKSREELEKKIKTLQDYIDGKKEEIKVDDKRVKRNKDLMAQLKIDAEEARQRDLDAEAEKRRKEAEEREKALTLIENYNKAINEKKQSALDRDIDAHKRHQDLLRQMAARGSEDAKDNLANEEKRIIEAQARKEKLLKKEKQQELLMSALKSFNSNLASEGDSTKALVKTIKDMAVLTAFVNSLPSFLEGVEDTGKGGDVDNKGGKMAIIHPNERIMTKEQNKMTEGLSNWELANAGFMHKNLNKDTGIKTDWQSNEKVLQKFDELKDSIENKPQLTEIDFDRQNESLIFRIESKNKIMRNHIRLNKLN